MAAFPLISHTKPDAVVAFRAGRPIDARRFLTDVRYLVSRMPAAAHILNMCTDRYHFAVGLAASLVSGKISLLSSTRTVEVIRQLGLFAPGAFCLTDDRDCDIDLPQIRYPLDTVQPDLPWHVPAIDGAQRAAYVFTSGSTGEQVPHPKTWGRLVQCVVEEARPQGKAYAIAGTVPPQHMFGLESTVLLPLQSGNTLCAERPFFPADIASAITALPRPRMLVSTPFHLRTLLAANIELPIVDLVLCSTAPLTQTLAHEVEARLGRQLLEIYGSTETGEIAARRTATTAEWQLWPNVNLTERGGRVWAHGGHLEQFTLMGDVLEPTGPHQFLMHGRSEDLVNIAGKRSSLTYLNHQLVAVPGVVDGAFFQTEEHDSTATGITRLAAFVVAPGLSATALQERLRERIDPAFLPRPLRLVDHLPRDATGKIPRRTLLRLLTSDASRASAQ
jgi:acyl-coenzyme A synthetase/AMP-(fatty) acid ligase